MAPSDGEFYIGWKSRTGVGQASFNRRFLLVLAALLLVFAGTLAFFQKKSGTANFEAGQLTEISGIYFSKPVPLLKVIAGRDIFGQPSYISIPLVGYGKTGAESVMKDSSNGYPIPTDGRFLTLKGTLLYNDGKTFLQLDKHDRPVVKVSSFSADSTLVPKIVPLGFAELKGEITDPKCFFGVMKPGEGKIHQDCAARCILGGIMPVLVSRNAKGEANYYLLVGEHGERINVALKNFVGQPVALEAMVVRYDDWFVAYVQRPEAIKRLSYLRSTVGDAVLSCAAPGAQQ